MYILPSKHARKNPGKPRNRANGEGSVFAVTKRLKDGTERTYYRAAKTITLPDGTRSKPIVKQGSTPAEAVERRDAAVLVEKVKYGLESQDKLPKDPKLNYYTVADCLADLLAEKGRQKKAPNTIKMYDSRIRNYLLPAFGEKPVRLLKRDELKQYFEVDLTDHDPPLGASSIKQIQLIMRSALERYVDLERLDRNPMKGFEVPKQKKRSREEREEIQKASEFLGEKLMDAVAEREDQARWFLGLLGLRQGEALGFCDDALITKGRGKGKSYRVVVKRQLQRVTPDHGCGHDSKGHWSCGRKFSTDCPDRLGDPGWELRILKSENGHREIDIPEEAWNMLAEHRERQRARRKQPGFRSAPGKDLDQLFFTRKTGEPIYAQRDRKALKQLLESIKGVPTDLTVHWLRHVATTVLIEHGAERDDLIAMMGWGSANADSQIAIYSSADKTKLAATTSRSYVNSFFKSGTKAGIA